MANVLLNIFCSLEFVFAHFVFFQQNMDIISINSLIIFIQAFFLYGILFSIGRKSTIFFAVLANILIVLLLIYHRVYEQPITLNTIFMQYNEGISYLQRAGNVFLQREIIITIIYLILIIVGVVVFYRSVNKKAVSISIFSFPLLIIIIFSYNSYHNHMFDKGYFKTYVEIFGYPQGWLYETITNTDSKSYVEDIIKIANEAPQPLPENLIKLKKHKHIFILQLESFHYFAFEKSVNGKKIMPYLNGLADRAALYQIMPKEVHPSASSDFAVLTGSYNTSAMAYVPYHMASPKELYSQITPVAQKYVGHNYYTRFYHGFVDTFYDRGPHIRAMGFSEVHFLNDIPNAKNMRQGSWGIDDMEMAKLIVKNQQENFSDRSLTFFATVSTHDPFDIGDSEKGIYINPKTTLERYYNGFNYVDNVIKYIMDNAPQNSLFIIYSDHPILKEEPQDTFFMVYSNVQNLKNFDKITFTQAMQIIKSILANNL